MKSKGIRPRPLAVQTIETIMSRTVEVGECCEWLGYFGNGVPQVTHEGRMASVRRLVLMLAGQKLNASDKVIPSCGNFRCVHQLHTIVLTHKQSLRRMNRISNQSKDSPVRIAKLQAVGRKRLAKLTLEQVREIRASEGTARSVGAQYGVAKSTVSNIRNGQRWRDIGMFSSLIAGGRP